MCYPRAEQPPSLHLTLYFRAAGTIGGYNSCDRYSERTPLSCRVAGCHHKICYADEKSQSGVSYYVETRVLPEQAALAGVVDKTRVYGAENKPIPRRKSSVFCAGAVPASYLDLISG